MRADSTLGRKAEGVIPHDRTAMIVTNTATEPTITAAGMPASSATTRSATAEADEQEREGLEQQLDGLPTPPGPVAASS